MELSGYVCPHSGLMHWNQARCAGAPRGPGLAGLAALAVKAELIATQWTLPPPFSSTSPNLGIRLWSPISRLPAPMHRDSAGQNANTDVSLGVPNITTNRGTNVEKGLLMKHRTSLYLLSDAGSMIFRFPISGDFGYVSAIACGVRKPCKPHR